MNCAEANIRTTKSYRIYKESVGGYFKIGCTNVEFKNFARDLKAYGAGCDAQMILNLMHKKDELSLEFYFQYVVGDNEQLSRLFRCDSIFHRNYEAFGDVVSLDATYLTNRYNMIFTPFTGIDNHRRIVTFAAGLLSKEETESYTWLIENFKDFMRHFPCMIITDQDPALKNSIGNVCGETRHRYCMWHITKKISERVPNHLKVGTTFMKKLDQIIWDEHMQPSDFENSWIGIMDEFGLNDHAWLNLIFCAREKWIPAYFKDCSLNGLLKTTSVSENANSFFGRFLNHCSNLVEFYMQFQNALDAQRHARHQLNSETALCNVELKMPLAIEKHAMEVYTLKVFIEIQSEIADACSKCRVLNINSDGVYYAYKVDDGVNGVFDVIFNTNDSTYTCSCKKFIRAGFLCCHVFVMFRHMKVDFIPEKYILGRWMKNALSKASAGTVVDLNGEGLEDHKVVLNQLYSEFYYCVCLIDVDIEKLTLLLGVLRDYRKSISSGDSALLTKSSKRKLFVNFYGSDVPDVVNVLPPTPVKTKGSGRRIKSSKEKTLKISAKSLRLYKKCNMRTNHDSRNYDKFSDGGIEK